jgi:predicted nucleic acid-binding protein
LAATFAELPSTSHLRLNPGLQCRAGATSSSRSILVEGELARRRGRIVIAPRVLEEFLHVVTDTRRFEEPFTMKAAIAFAESILATRDVVRLAQQASAAPRMLELLSQHRLGRKRILDTALAATLEAGGVRRLATFNGADFAVFDFLEIVDPRRD